MNVLKKKIIFDWNGVLAEKINHEVVINAFKKYGWG